MIKVPMSRDAMCVWGVTPKGGEKLLGLGVG